MPLEVEILTPSRVLVQEQVDELNVPGELGCLGILPGHMAFLTILGQGELMYRRDQARDYLSLFGGHMEVNNDQVIVLAEIAEPAREIDRARAALERAVIRLQVAGR